MLQIAGAIVGASPAWRYRGFSAAARGRLRGITDRGGRAIGIRSASMSTPAPRGPSRWPRRLALYALVGLLVGVAMIFLGTSVAPCLGSWATPGNTPCVEAWQASKNVIQRLHDAFGPWSLGIGAFVILVVAAAAVDRMRARR